MQNTGFIMEEYNINAWDSYADIRKSAVNHFNSNQEPVIYNVTLIMMNT